MDERMETQMSPVLSALVPQLPPGDTVVMVLARDGLGMAAAVSVIVVGVFFLLLVPLVVLLLFQVRKMNRTVRSLGEKGLRSADPILERGKGIADNVEFVSLAVRNDVERLTASVKALAGRLQRASDRMEERIAEFNALMDVVQSEAEDIFVGTAATFRGVRAGTRSLGEPPPSSAAAETERKAATEEEEEEEEEVYVSRPEDGR